MSKLYFQLMCLYKRKCNYRDHIFIDFRMLLPFTLDMAVMKNLIKMTNYKLQLYSRSLLLSEDKVIILF